MKIAQIKIIAWDKPSWYAAESFALSEKDQVVVKFDKGVDLGKIVKIDEVDEEAGKNLEIAGQIARRVTTDDLNRAAEFEKKINEAIEYCKKATEKRKLPMKIVDAHFSLDNGRLTFAFIADGRIDFRELVKDLTHHYQKSIRLHQLGIRDEAKMAGDIGVCGRGLCCANHLKELVSITSDMADLQQVSHRGSERISGICGRLRCCLAFEKNTYEELGKKMPALGSTVKTKQGEGKVVGLNVLKQTVDIIIGGDAGNIIEAPVNAIKSK